MQLRTACLLVMFIFLTGCTGMQPVQWKDSHTIKSMKISSIEIETLVHVPKHEIAFMKTDIEDKLKYANFWSEESSDYTLKVIIDTYDEGNAFARAVFIGLGQMHLNGTVELLIGNPPKVVKTGFFEKNYAMGGVVGASASMHKNVVANLGNAIIDALRKPTQEDS